MSQASTTQAAPRLERGQSIYGKNGRTGFSKSTIYNLIREGKFPRPIALGPRAVAWPMEQVDAWINSRIECGQKVGMPA